ncbi:hypothetical protein D3C85_1494050 [compost metagenome]
MLVNVDANASAITQRPFDGDDVLQVLLEWIGADLHFENAVATEFQQLLSFSNVASRIAACQHPADF